MGEAPRERVQGWLASIFARSRRIKDVLNGETVHATRERIVRAAFELHRDVGPAQATVKAIAARAGVERHTVYRHFPDLVALIRACTDFGMQTTGLPEPDHWRRIREPLERLQVALTEVYRYWRANERLVENIMRDAPVMPALVEGSASYQDHLARIWLTVLEPWSVLAQAELARALERWSRPFAH